MHIIVNVIIKNENKILMVQENWGNVKGMWNFPAGRLDENENVFDGAVREAKEETGYDVALTGLISIQNTVFNDRHVVHINFAAEVIGGEVGGYDPGEIAKVEYVDIDKLLAMSYTELRGGDIRKETINRVLEGKVLPLDAVSNFDFRDN